MSIRLKSKGILVIGKIDTPEELIAWYQQASVFVNPTLADNFPTTNIEALAAGTPVVTFRTGGSSEAINESSGIIVEKGDVNGLVDAIQTIVQHPEKYTKEECISQSSSFSVQQYNHYVELYHKMMNV